MKLVQGPLDHRQPLVGKLLVVGLGRDLVAARALAQIQDGNKKELFPCKRTTLWTNLYNKGTLYEGKAHLNSSLAVF